MSTVVAIGPCKDCGRPMIPQRVARRRPELLATHVRSNAYGMCVGCYSRAGRVGTLPDPAPRRPKAAPRTSITATYLVYCDQCGGVLTTTSREDARRAKQRHTASHKSTLAVSA